MQTGKEGFGENLTLHPNSGSRIFLLRTEYALSDVFDGLHTETYLCVVK